MLLGALGWLVEESFARLIDSSPRLGAGPAPLRLAEKLSGSDPDNEHKLV
jgi:hypothetical protein